MGPHRSTGAPVSRSGSWLIGGAAAVLVPSAATYLVAYLRLPAFIFEHLIVLLVVIFALRWGMGSAVVAAVVAVSADNVLLREPIGQPAITGLRDLLDLVLFVVVAATVGWLLANVQRERLRAEDAAERERRAREDRDRLVAMVSHDLATPLSAIRGTVQFAQRHGGKADVDMSRLLTRLETASTRAASLVKTLSDAAAIEQGDFALNLAPADLRILVAPIVQMLDRTSDRHPIALATPDAPVMVQCDAERLQRVVENLITNAIKYSPEGGPVEVSVAAERGNAILSVRDYGIGISKEALPHIFDRSFRAREAVGMAPGLGLGLSIAAEIVSRHGGEIRAQPAEPRGTVVSLSIPLEGTRRRAGRLPAEAGSYSSGSSG